MSATHFLSAENNQTGFLPKVKRPRRHGVEERVRVRRRALIHGDKGRLAGIREEQARVREQQPADLDGRHAEGAEVGKEGLDARKGEQQAAERLPAVVAVAREVVKGVGRVEGPQDRVVVRGQVVDARAEVEEEPDGDNGGKCRAELGRAKGLQEEEDDEEGASGGYMSASFPMAK